MSETLISIKGLHKYFGKNEGMLFIDDGSANKTCLYKT